MILASFINYFDMWSLLAWKDVTRKHARTHIGMLWYPLSMGIFIFCLGSLYTLILGYDSKFYIPYLSAGLLVWQFILRGVNEGANAFISSRLQITNLPIPPFVYIFRSVYRNLLIFMLTLITHIIVLIVMQYRIGAGLLLFPVGLLLIVINAIWVGTILGVLCARYRDLVPLIGNIMQPMFFITPIIWHKDKIGTKADLFTIWNPFYHFVEIVRAPLLMQVPEMFSILYVSVITIFGCFIAYIIYSKMGRKIVYFL